MLLTRNAPFPRTTGEASGLTQSPLPFGGWPSRDSVDLSPPIWRTNSLHCLSAVGPLGTGSQIIPADIAGLCVSIAFRRLALSGLAAVAAELAAEAAVSIAFRRLALSGRSVRPMGWSDRAPVSIAFRRLALSGLYAIDLPTVGTSAPSPLPFGGWPSRDPCRNSTNPPFGGTSSPLPFGGWPSRDQKKPMRTLPRQPPVSIAFRRLALSGRESEEEIDAYETCLHCLSAVGPLGTAR